MAKSHNQYGPPVINNIGVYQGSAISALLFIIYLGDMMEDYDAVNANKQALRKKTKKDVRENN